MAEIRWRAPAPIRQWITDELDRGRRTGDVWSSLERAHIVSQSWAWKHSKIHAAMLGTAIRERDRHETIGQLIRLVVAAPGSLTDRYPTGNTGRSSMALMATAPVPDDLAAVPGSANLGG